MTVPDEQLNSKPSQSTKSDPLIGTQVGNYAITRLLGVGGMARVYEAYHQTLDRRVALKILSEQHEDDAELMQRYHREARTLARLEHPRIVTLFEVGETERSYYIAMRYIDGQTLTSVLKNVQSRLADEYGA
jgi:serine/threonine-protein kinase